MKLLVAPFRHTPHNVCRSVILRMPQAPTRFRSSLPPFGFRSRFRFRSLSVSRKVSYSFLLFCVVFKVRLSVTAFAIPENDTEFFQKNIRINRFCFVSLSLTRMCFAFALSSSACCTLIFQLLLTLTRSASVSFRFPRLCSTSESEILSGSHVSLERR